jgi:hypothetical protein
MSLKPYKMLRTSVQGVEDELANALKEGYVPAEGGIAYQTPIVLVLLQNPAIVEKELALVNKRLKDDIQDAIESLEAGGKEGDSPVVDQSFPALGKGAADVGAGAADLLGDAEEDQDEGELHLDPATGSKDHPVKRDKPQVGHGHGQVIGQPHPKKK